MDYAIQMLIPIMGGLLLGYWLNQHFGVDPIWMVILAILGMVGGILILYKRFTYPELYPQSDKQKLPNILKKSTKAPSGKSPAPSTSPSQQDAPEKKTAVPIEQLDFLYKDPNEHDDFKHPYQDEDDFKTP